MFRSEGAEKRQCWQPPNTCYHETHIQHCAVSGSVSVSFWEWMWAHGPGALVKINVRFTGKQYVDILEQVLLPTVRAMAVPVPHTIRLVHDNSPIHTNNVVKDYLHDRPEIELINWPTQECDINPIEHIWAMMKCDWDIAEQRTCAAIEAKAYQVWESTCR